mmetsp:Transcript_49943/g.139877  ORF Transcript_49943/g.139877 Transcript_49943/m.139877 type:complete len:361 (-) Transcript_49943:1253-2335(-)
MEVRPPPIPGVFRPPASTSCDTRRPSSLAPPSLSKSVEAWISCSCDSRRAISVWASCNISSNDRRSSSCSFSCLCICTTREGNNSDCRGDELLGAEPPCRCCRSSGLPQPAPLIPLLATFSMQRVSSSRSCRFSSRSAACWLSNNADAVAAAAASLPPTQAASSLVPTSALTPTVHPATTSTDPPTHEPRPATAIAVAADDATLTVGSSLFGIVCPAMAWTLSDRTFSASCNWAFSRRSLAFSSKSRRLLGWPSAEHGLHFGLRDTMRTCSLRRTISSSRSRNERTKVASSEFLPAEYTSGGDGERGCGRSSSPTSNSVGTLAEQPKSGCVAWCNSGGVRGADVGNDGDADSGSDGDASL